MESVPAVQMARPQGIDFVPEESGRRMMREIDERVFGKKVKPVVARGLDFDDLPGAPGRTRTCDARFRKPTLYPLSYGGAEVREDAHGLHTRCASSSTVAERPRTTARPTHQAGFWRRSATQVMTVAITCRAHLSHPPPATRMHRDRRVFAYAANPPLMVKEPLLRRVFPGDLFSPRTIQADTCPHERGPVRDPPSEKRIAGCGQRRGERGGMHEPGSQDRSGDLVGGGR